MTTSPLVSIITPTFNHERFIIECVESVRRQSYSHWEQIIVDDGSTDGTPDILRQYAENDPRIRVFFQSHKGPQRLKETYNFALAQAHGDWIAILEGDDYWFPEKLEAQLARHTADTVFSYGAYVDEIDDRLLPGKQPPFHGSLDTQQFIQHLLLHRSYMLAVTQLIHRDVLAAIGGFHQDGSPAAVDFATLLRLARVPGEIVYIAQPLGVWRHHQWQSTNLRAIELALFNSQRALQFYDSLPESTKRAIGITRNEIIRARRAQVADAYFGVLRATLRARQRTGISRLIVGTWKYGGTKRKVQALYATGAVLVGCDFEPLLSIGERVVELLKCTIRAVPR